MEIGSQPGKAVNQLSRMEEIEIPTAFALIFQTGQAERIQAVGKTPAALSGPFSNPLKPTPVGGKKADQEICFTKFPGSGNNTFGNMYVHMGSQAPWIFAEVHFQ